MSDHRVPVTKVHGNQIAPKWSAVFATTDPFGWPFAPAFQRGRVFYPTSSELLREEQYRLLIETIEAIGDPGYIIANVEYSDFLDRDFGIYWCDYAPSYAQYLELYVGGETVLFSTQGRWGVFPSHEDHALIAGDEEFMSKLEELYVDWDKDLERLVRFWAKYPNSAGWLDQVLPRVT